MVHLIYYDTYFKILQTIFVGFKFAYWTSKTSVGKSDSSVSLEF